MPPHTLVNTSGGDSTVASLSTPSSSSGLPPPPDVFLEYPLFFTHQGADEDEKEAPPPGTEDLVAPHERGSFLMQRTGKRNAMREQEEENGATPRSHETGAAQGRCSSSPFLNEGEKKMEAGKVANRRSSHGEAASAPHSKRGRPGASRFPFRHVTLFTSLYWLFPLYILAGWLNPHDPAVVQALSMMRNEKKEGKNAVAADSASVSHGSENKRVNETKNHEEEEEDVRFTRCVLPLMEIFFEEKQRLIPPNAMVYRQVQVLHFPTPKGAFSVSRAKVEGEEQPPRPSYVHTKMAPGAAAAAVVNPPGVFCLWPGHNQFLIHYETKEKMRCFTYTELDRLRFAFVALKEYILEEFQVYHRHDGTITGLARRDIRNNCRGDPRWSVEGSSSSSGSAGIVSEDKKSGKSRVSTNPSAATAVAALTGSSSGGGPRASAAGGVARVGQGRGNARLHQGTSGNVVTAPSTADIQQRKEVLQNRFLKEELQNMCLARWPHAPLHKSCIYVTLKEKKQCDLDGTETLGLGAPSMNAANRKGGARKGPTYYLCAVELPLFNKKGGTAKFTAEAWWTTKVDGESDAAQVAIRALQNLKG